MMKWMLLISKELLLSRWFQVKETDFNFVQIDKFLYSKNGYEVTSETNVL